MNIGDIFYKKKQGTLSIDFGQAFLKVAYAKMSGRNISDLCYSLESISVLERSGRSAADFINGFLKAHSIQEKEAALTVSDPDSIVTKLVVLPALPKDEILEAVKWQLKNEIPFDIEKALFDWQLVKEYVDDEGAKKNEVMCVFAKPELLDRHIQLLSSCLLSPERVSTGPFNYANILRSIQDQSAVQAVLDIGYSEAKLCFYKKAKLAYVRNLPFSSDKLTRCLTTMLVSEKGPVELSYDKAEETKMSFGIPSDEAAELSENITAIHVISLMRPFLEGLSRELKRSFEYFSSHFKEGSPVILYLTGGGANLKNLGSYLQKDLGVSIAFLPLPCNFDAAITGKEEVRADQNQITSVLGAVLADRDSVNFLPQEIKAKKIELIEKVSLRVVGIALAAIFLFSLSVIKFQVYDYKKRLKTTSMHLDGIQGIKQSKQRIDSRQNLIDKIEKDKVPVDRLLKFLSNVVPQGIYLDELVLDQGRHDVVLSGAVSMPGVSPDAVLTLFMQQIESSAFFTEATLVVSKEKEGGREFQIKCDLSAI
ncbi:MAG: pilus assembly protein PilM [Candidatus Omnitrophica bacterium]|nr:pilus assembly protein PilM [Candidatus Omnitrophota bacterium]